MILSYILDIRNKAVVLQQNYNIMVLRLEFELITLIYIMQMYYVLILMISYKLQCHVVISIFCYMLCILYMYAVPSLFNMKVCILVLD